MIVRARLALKFSGMNGRTCEDGVDFACLAEGEEEEEEEEKEAGLFDMTRNDDDGRGVDSRTKE